jgi:hypothetical protein
VLVIGGSEPEADGLEAEVVDAPLAPAGEFRLVENDVILVLGSLVRE